MIRDWFRLVLWYIRIRKASKTGSIHSSLLEIECRAGPSKKVIDPKRAVKQAEWKDKPIQTLGDKLSNKESFVQPSSASSEDIEDVIKRNLKEAISRSSRAKREFFSGIKLQLRIDTIELRVHSRIREIIEFKMQHPNLHIKLSNICFKAGFMGADLAI